MTRRSDGVTCIATSKSTGNRCGNPPVPGGTVCKIHGGSAPQVKAVAASRVLEALVGPALVEMRRLIEDATVADSVKIRAVIDILDRGGYKPIEKVAHLTAEDVERHIARLEAEQIE